MLVEKNAKVIIKKTFVGDSEAIDEVKKNYSITVTKSDDSKDTRTLTLKAASSSDSTDLGYTTYDKATDTYTWVVEGYQGEQYTVKEQNYTAKDITIDKNSRAGTLKKAFTSTSRYSIHNAENHEHDTNGDKPYTDDGVSVTMAAYATDIDKQYYQTVHLTNIYAQAGILTLSKADGVTGHGLGNVQFKLSNQNGSELELLRRPNTNQYSVKTQQAGKLGYTETVPDNIVQTDANGYVQLRLPPLIDGDTLDVSYEGKYYLEEILPERQCASRPSSDILERTSESHTCPWSDSLSEWLLCCPDCIDGIRTPFFISQLPLRLQLHLGVRIRIFLQRSVVQRIARLNRFLSSSNCGHFPAVKRVVVLLGIFRVIYHCIVVIRTQNRVRRILLYFGCRIGYISFDAAWLHDFLVTCLTIL